MKLPALLASAAGALLLAAAAHAAANPPIRMASEGVEYMCGGKNQDELAFMERVAPRWAATLEFAVARAPRGQFSEPVQVNVRNRYNGDHVLSARASGPLMLARLEPGTYDVEATLGTLTLKQTLVIGLGAPGRALFLWPSNFDMAAATLPRQALAQDSADKGE
ncbi:MAG: hypothetical protein QM586_06135 [Xenophilus sp.]